jgi:TPR repeat protein
MTKAVNVDDARPVLLSTRGNAPKWKNLAQLQQSAAHGDPQACFELGTNYLEGNGVDQNPTLGIGLLEQAAKGGIANASFRLGKIYYDGTVVPVNYARALEYYTIAARAGVFEAQHNIGVMLVGAKGVKRDYVEGLAWLLLATQSGAPATIEEQVRVRLKKYPEKIQAAVLRMSELEQALPQAIVKAELIGAEAPTSPAAPLRPALAAPVIAPQKKIVIPLQKIEVTGALPQPFPEPKQPPIPATTEKP